MIPLILSMQADGMDVSALWWALSLGACLGGNGTLIGASANVVLSGISAKHGHPITFARYLRVGFPMMVLSVALSAGCLLLFFAGGMLSPVRASENPQDDASSLEFFSEKYCLTPRETEVLAAIVDNDRGIRELAEELHISERTAYRHITSIYEKTGASSRLGLSLIYYGKYKGASDCHPTSDTDTPSETDGMA